MRIGFFDSKFACFAHRGGWVNSTDVSRENSIYAFSQAVKLGYEYLETDIHATRDGKLIAFHDRVLDRVTDRSGVIADLDWAEVKKAKIAGIDPIPTLDEVLDSFPEIRLNIDMKTPATVRPLIDVLSRHNAQNRVCVASFNFASMRKFRKLSPFQVVTSASPIEVIGALAKRRVKPFPIQPVAFQVPLKAGFVGVKVVTKRFVDSCHQAGKKVHVWTINNPETMRRLIKLGVDGIVSDDIVTLKNIATEMKVWSR